MKLIQHCAFLSARKEEERPAFSGAAGLLDRGAFNCDTPETTMQCPPYAALSNRRSEASSRATRSETSHSQAVTSAPGTPERRTARIAVRFDQCNSLFERRDSWREHMNSPLETA